MHAQSPSIRSPLHRWAQALSELRGWRRVAVSLAAGAAAALALPPLYLLPGAVIGFTLLIWLLPGARTDRQALGIGWFFGLGHFIVGVHWVANAFLTDPARYGWMIPFAVGGLAGILALFPAIVVMAIRRLKPGPVKIAGFAVAWTLAEMARAIVATGFPWNPMGHIWGFSDIMLQSASLVGVWGLSALSVFVMAVPALLGMAGSRRAGLALGLALLLLGGQFLFGLARLDGAHTQTVPGISLRLVQPAIAQTDKNRSEYRPQMIQTGLDLSRRPGPTPPTHIIWAESAVPYILNDDPGLIAHLQSAVPADGLLLTGALRGRFDGTRVAEAWNSFAALNAAGMIVGQYDKAHLVPFGEYAPLQSIFPFIDKLTPGGNFSAGPGPRTLRLPGLPPVSVLICYEVIFPSAVIDRQDRPQWLLNLTNDAWFGDSAGPRQHFVTARLRSIEEGLPLVRVANSGISGVIDAYGRVRSFLPLGERGFLDAPLPAAIDAPLFSQARDAAVGVWFVVILALGWLLSMVKIDKTI